MTVCLCWREDEHSVHLAADSRLNYPGTTVDIGAKVVRVDARLTGPRDLEEHFPTFVVQLGMACAGNALATLTLSDTLSHVLRRLQYGPLPPRLEAVAETVAKFFRSVSSKFVNALFERGEFAFALGGRCPVDERTKLFFFEVTVVELLVEVSWREALVDGERTFAFGSGKRRVERALGAGRHPLDAVKDVIEDEDEPTVGGFVQYGRFGRPGHGFQLFALEDFEVDHEAREVRAGIVFRGLPIYDEAPPGFELGLPYSQQVLLPFAQRRDHYLDDGYELVPLKGVGA